jgi:ADP-heptose:LPS heptosyltransferase
MSFKCRPWRSEKLPERILILRFHALGDLMITLPYIASLKKKIPLAFFTLLTSREFSDLPKNLLLFDEVIDFNSHRNGKLQLLLCLLKLPMLWLRRFEIVIDLQNNKASRMIRYFLFPKSWTQFDKRSLITAGERTQTCLTALGLGNVSIDTELLMRDNQLYKTRIAIHSLKEYDYIILNPGGSFPSRNWPTERYVQFCEAWLKKDQNIQFLVLGMSTLSAKAEQLKKDIGNKVIDLCGKTTLVEAFALIHKSKLVLTEDGGLMHMAWTQGVPTVALFGSTASYWSTPLGHWSICLNSSDLPCGNCLLAECRFGDNRCLTRYSSQMVFERSVQLLDSLK